MTIASEIQRIKTNVENAYDALENLGATMPATEDTDHLVETIQTVSGGDEVTAKNESGSAVTNGDKVWIHEVNEAPSASIGTKTTNPMATASYDRTIFGSNGNGVVNGHTSGGSYPYEVSNNLNTFTRGSTAVSYSPSTGMTFVGENICLMNSYNGQPQLYDGSTVTDLQNYVGGWKISGSNGGYVVYTNGNTNTSRRIVSLSDGSYVDCAGPNVQTSEAVYDKNTGKLYSINSSYCLTFDKENGSYTYSNITISGGGDSYCEKPALTSDGKYIIPQRYYSDDPQYMNSYVLKLFKISGNTYTLVTDSVFGQWLSTGCDVFYNPNCDVLVCTNRNTGQCGFFKYTPATETWSEISVDLSSIATFTNFQAPIQVNNQNNQMMIKTGNSGGDFRTNGGKIYLANYTVSGGGLVWKIESFSEVTSEFLSGIAQENIAVDATGTVKTILPTTQENNNEQGSGGNEQGSGGSELGPTPGDWSGTEEW